MAYLTVDLDGTEIVWDRRPHRNSFGSWEYDEKNPCCFVELPNGTIKKITGEDMIFDDDPVKI